MINQLGTGRDEPTPQILTAGSSNVANNAATPGLSGNTKETTEMDPSSVATSFLSSLSGSRPRRFSASFSPVCMLISFILRSINCMHTWILISFDIFL